MLGNKGGRRGRAPLRDKGDFLVEMRPALVLKIIFLVLKTVWGFLSRRRE